WGVPLLLDSLTLMLLVRFLFGAGEAGAYPNLTRVVATWFPFRERGLAQGAIWMSARLGGALAPSIIGRLSAVVGWRQAFAVLGGVGFAWAAAFWFWSGDSPRQMAGCNDAERDLIHPPAPAGGGGDSPSSPSGETGITADIPAGVLREGIQAGPPPK